MSRQFKNGSCSCWKQADKHLDKEGTALVRAISFSGHQYLEIKTERIDDKLKPSHRVVAAFCPFCGMKLKVARTGRP